MGKGGWTMTEGPRVAKARYLYAIASTREKQSIGNIGIDESAVYTIPFKSISAVVHSCEPRPYETRDRALAEGWILEHSYVIDQAMKLFGTVLPFSFDVIVRGDDSTIEGWLCRNYDRLASELQRVEGRAEYSVEIYYDYDQLAEEALRENQELRELASRIEKEPKGRAYMLKRTLDHKLKEIVASEARRQVDRAISQIKSLADEAKVETKRSQPPEKYRDKRLIGSYSCLVHTDSVNKLGDVLEEINALSGFAVRFTGPWAPFSFVKLGDAA